MSNNPSEYHLKFEIHETLIENYLIDIMECIVHTIKFNRDLKETDIILQGEIIGLQFFYPILKEDLVKSIKKHVVDVLGPMIEKKKIEPEYEVEIYVKPRWFGRKNVLELWRISVIKREELTWGEEEKKEALKNHLHQLVKDIIKQKKGNDVNDKNMMFRVAS